MMMVRTRARLFLVASALALAAAALAGCSRYCGEPKGLSTHPYCLNYPGGFTHHEMPQMTRDAITLSLITEEKIESRSKQVLPGVIYVRCQRMRKADTERSFIERYYDMLAASYLDIKMRKVKSRSGYPEWDVSATNPYMDARVIMLPKERLVYDVVTSAASTERARLEKAFRHARESFRLEPIPKAETKATRR